MYKVGDKVTIRESRKYTEGKPVGVTTVESINTRAIKTIDGRRWHAKFNHEVDACGSEIGSHSIGIYRPGDEERIARVKRLDRARVLLRGHVWEVEQDFDLLSDEDLDSLGQIAKRLVLARKRRAEAMKDKEIG